MTRDALGCGEVGRRAFLRGAGVAAVGVVVARPGRTAVAQPAVPRADRHGPEVAHRWTELLYDRVKAEGTTPPAAARAYAYLAIAGYEAVVPGMPHLRSLRHCVPGMPAVPPPPGHGRVDWPAVVAAASSVAVRGVSPTQGTADAAAARLAADVDERRSAGVPQSVLDASVAHGRAVADVLVRWAARDGAAEAAVRPYEPPVGEGLWEPTPPNHGRAIEPFAGTVRTFPLRSGAEVQPPPRPCAYSSDPSSAFAAQGRAVLEASRQLTDEQREIAGFWTDNPLRSGLPSGHWMLLACLHERLHGLDLGAGAEVRARLGIALHDAFTSCWSVKYVDNLLRPVTYLNRHLVEPGSWSSYVNSPQFPGYTSGHSVSSAAAALVLTDLLGTRPFVDDTGRRNGLAPRAFTSFHDAAEEAARSRLYGGIHFPMDIDEGLTHGQHVGRLVLSRLRTRRDGSR